MAPPPGVTGLRGGVHDLRPLLRRGEDEVPAAVLATASFMAHRGVWHRFSRNPIVRGCRDAARKRDRLGTRGIPLWDELKSFFGRVMNSSGRAQFVVVHCRGDRLVDLAAVQQAVRSRTTPERLSTDELERLGMAYGLVNPFEPWEAFAMDGRLLATSVLQVFDEELRTPLGVPGTVMTNAGDLTWAVEFHARELADSIDHTLWAPVSAPDRGSPPRLSGLVEPSPIGIVTGNAPESGIALWTKINERVRRALGEQASDMTMPPVLVRSLPGMGLSMELDHRRDAVWAVLREAVAGLCQDGARRVAVACNTTQYFAPELRQICSEYGAEFVALADVVADWLRAQGVSRVGLVGIRYVSDQAGGWSAYRVALEGFEVEQPSPNGMARITQLAYEVKARGPDPALLNKLRNLLRDEIEASHVLLALTELSVLLGLPSAAPTHSGNQILVDPLDLYADALATRHVAPVHA